MRRLLYSAMAGILLSVSLGGCYTMGKGAGEVSKSAREGKQDFKEGYREGKK